MPGIEPPRALVSSQPCRGASRRTSDGFEGDLLGPCSCIFCRYPQKRLLACLAPAAGGRALAVPRGSPLLPSGSWRGWSWEEGSGKQFWGWEVVGRVEKASGASW